MTYEIAYKNYSDFVDHFQDSTRDSMCFSNWVDNWAYNNGYRIQFAGGITPERHWFKNGFKLLVVRNFEVNGSGKLPINEPQLLNWINNGVLWK